MSGHSKWHNIQQRKGVNDAKRGKIFTKIIKEITIAARSGEDPTNNSALRSAIQKAKDNNMPKKNWENAIKKASGKDAALLMEITYEGYGPGGIAILIETVTDNKNRTVGEVRSILSKRGGSMAETGAVGYLFKAKGIVLVNKEAIAEDSLMEIVLDAGGEDLVDIGDMFEVSSDLENFESVKNSLAEKSIEIVSSELSKIPDNLIPVTGEAALKMVNLISALEDNDDVVKVYSNSDFDEEELEKLLQ